LLRPLLVTRVLGFHARSDTKKRSWGGGGLYHSAFCGEPGVVVLSHYNPIGNVRRLPVILLPNRRYSPCPPPPPKKKKRARKTPPPPHKAPQKEPPPAPKKTPPQRAPPPPPRRNPQDQERRERKKKRGQGGGRSPPSSFFSQFSGVTVTLVYPLIEGTP